MSDKAHKKGSRKTVKGAEDTRTAEQTPERTRRAEQAQQPGAGTAAEPGRGGRLPVWKTYKLYVGGKFPRSESGRVYEVTSAQHAGNSRSTDAGVPAAGAGGRWLANAPLASRKDARDAVVAARKAFGGWSGRTAYNRGQILFRIAEMLEGRHAQFTDEVAEAEGLERAEAAASVDAAIDRWVWYAGWTDKVAQVVGGANPVAGPYFNLSSPEPTGVVAVLAPQESSLLGLVSVLAPVIATGNTAVVVTSERAPLPALSLAEVLATSDLPGGVVNILSGRTQEIAGPLAAHQDVNALDLTGAAGDEQFAKALEIAAADNLKRVLRPLPDCADWFADPGTRRLTAFLETKTVWHPTGSLGAAGSAY